MKRELLLAIVLLMVVGGWASAQWCCSSTEEPQAPRCFESFRQCQKIEIGMRVPSGLSFFCCTSSPTPVVPKVNGWWVEALDGTVIYQVRLQNPVPATAFSAVWAQTDCTGEEVAQGYYTVVVSTDEGAFKKHIRIVGRCQLLLPFLSLFCFSPASEPEVTLASAMEPCVPADPCTPGWHPGAPPCTPLTPVCTDAPYGKTVMVGESISLRARVYDHHSDHLRVTWSAPRGSFSDPHALETRYYAPSVTTCEGEDVRVTITVVDQCGGEGTDTVVIRVLRENRPPVVDAGPDRTVNEGEQVQIEASAYDPDNDEMSFTWTAECGQGSFVDPHVLSPVYIAPRTGPCQDETVTLTLSVRDECGAVSKDSMRVHVRGVSRPPSVNAGPDLMVREEGQVMIHAEAEDPDGGPLTVSWWASEGSFQDVHTLKPLFLAPSTPCCEGLDIEVRVQVKDCSGNTAEDTLIIHVFSVKPPPKVTIECGG